jgi:hypothetical protein
MKFLKRLVAKWVQEAQEERYSNGKGGILIAKDVDSNTVNDEPILNFRIYSAQNGKIIEFHRYDRKTDRSDKSVYIVEKDKDLSEYVNKCLSLELLR